MVQHYFRSREEMLSFAIRYADEQLRARIEQRLEPQTHPEPAATLQAFALALLPTDDDSRTGALVNIAFFIRSLNSPELAESLKQGYAQLVAQLMRQIAAGQQSGHINPRLCPDGKHTPSWPWLAASPPPS